MVFPPKSENSRRKGAQSLVQGSKSAFDLKGETALSKRCLYSKEQGTQRVGEGLGHYVCQGT